MELSAEIIDANKFTPEQVAAVKGFGESYVAEQKKNWDGKANENAEKILEGVVTSTQKLTGIQEPRLQGEKHADYLLRINSKYLETQKNELSTAKADLETKLREFKGGDILKSDLDKAQKAYDELLQKTADYDDIKKKATDYETVSTELSELKKGTAFRDVKPNFPDTVNTYESKAKWDEFVAKTLKTHDVELVDGVPMAISKENKYSIVSLESLVKADASISALATGRQQQGSGAAQAKGNPIEIEGVPFAVSEAAKTDSKERGKLIDEHLKSKGLSIASAEYGKLTAEYNSKIINSKK